MLAALGLAALGGCVGPGKIDPTVLNRYQRVMMDRSPQKRSGEEGPDLVRPARTVGPALSIEPIVADKIVTTTTALRQEAGEAFERSGRALRRIKVTWKIVVVSTLVSDPNTPREAAISKPRQVSSTERTEVVEVPAGQNSLPAETRQARYERFGRISKAQAIAHGAKSMIALGLQEAVRRALANNPAIRVASYDPAISREEMISAAAAFDPAFTATYGLDRVDEVPTSTFFGGGKSDTQVFEAGLTQNLITGGSWAAKYSFTRVWDNSSSTTLHTRFEPKLLLEVSQPLLRDGWPQFVLAALRIARLNRRTNEAAFRKQVERTVTEVITVYLSLKHARRSLKIQRSLLAMSLETLARVRARVGIDATDVEIKQTEAAVADRRVAVLRARRQILTEQDNLLKLLADPQLHLLSDVEIVPVTPMSRAEVKLNVADQIRSALAHNPDLEQLRVAVAGARINVQIAENQALPRLNLTGSAAWQGLAADKHEAHEEMATFDHFSYSIAVTFELPIGNRQRAADLRKAELERLKEIAGFQAGADEVARAVKEQIRDVRVNYQEIPLARAKVDAARTHLQALENTERIRGKLTPEFLQLKLNAQELLAGAELEEHDAIRRYNSSLALLHRLTGATLKMMGVETVALPVDLPGAISNVLGESDWPTPPGPRAPTSRPGPR